jgi:hypothetical protein
METDGIRIGVVMQRRQLGNRWQSFQWRPMEIVADVGLYDAAPRCLFEDEAEARWLFPGIELKLYSDEGEGYFLNISAPQPCWFIMWRLEERDGIELAVPKSLTLSYNEAARLMDGGECVDTLPLSSDIREWLAAFTGEHYHPEPKKKRRKPSFEGGEGVDEMARAEGARHGR